MNRVLHAADISGHARATNSRSSQLHLDYTVFDRSDKGRFEENDRRLRSALFDGPGGDHLGHDCATGECRVKVSLEVL